MNIKITLLLFMLLIQTLFSCIRPKDDFEIHNQTFLGNFQRNYYGSGEPKGMDILAKFNLGTGATIVRGDYRVWSGTGWTGQALIVEDEGIPYIVIGAYDHHLRKIDLQALLNGEGQKAERWRYKYPDVVKGSGTIYIDRTADESNRIVVLHGSRYGKTRDNNVSVTNSKYIWSFRAVSFRTGKELWRMNSEQGKSWSRDNDSSPIILSNSMLLFNANENGIGYFIDSRLKAAKDISSNILPGGYKTQRIYARVKLYEDDDIPLHKGEITTESSPSIMGRRLFITSSSGHIFGIDLSKIDLYNPSKLHYPDWDLETGSDIDGSPVVSKDGRLYCTIEKEFIEGPGGIAKINPEKEPSNAIEWYFPVGDKHIPGLWNGGIIGSAVINDKYNESGCPPLVAANSIDGNLYVVSQNTLEKGLSTYGPRKEKEYPVPKLVFKHNIGGAISTPIFAEGDKIISAGYNGYVYLFKINYEETTLSNEAYILGEDGKPYEVKVELEAKSKRLSGIEAAPVVYKGYTILSSRDGNLYVFGKKEE